MLSGLMFNSSGLLDIIFGDLLQETVQWDSLEILSLDSLGCRWFA